MSHSPTPDDELLKVCAELRERLLAGDTVRVEHYLDAYPSLASVSQHAVALILAEYSVRCELGQTPDPDEWLNRFARWSEELRPWLKLLKSSPSAVPSDSSTVAETNPRETLPSLGYLVLLGILGEGGMGVVFLAYDPLVGREVALKRMRPGMAARSESVSRFRRETHALGRLDHPGILPVLSLGLSEGELAYTMPLVRGGTLGQHLDRLHADLRTGIAVMVKVARAMEHAHQHGVVHRDLKPSNILLDGDEPRVADFGLARAEGDVELTLSGMMLGTPAYMSPEQITGTKRATRPEVDVWSLGVILYQLCTRKKPFGERQRDALIQAVLAREPLPPSRLRLDLPAPLEAIILRCLNKNPRKRYAHAGLLAEELERWQRGEAILESRIEQWSRWLLKTGSVRQSILAALLALLVPLVSGALLFSPTSRSVEPAHQEAQISKREGPEQLLDAVRRGRRVTLIGAEDNPRYYSWKTEPHRPPLTSDRQALPFRYTCYGTIGLLELLPEIPVKTFCLTGEVHLARGAPTCRFGLYLCHEMHKVKDASEHYFLGLYLNQVQPEKLEYCPAHVRFVPPARNERGAIHELPALTLPTQIYPLLDVLATLPNAMAGPLHRSQLLAGNELEGDRWQRLSVRVSPSALELSLNNRPMGRWDLPELRRVLPRWLRQLPGALHLPEFRVQGGLGLIVKDADVDVRNVVIESLSPEKLP